MQTAPVLAVLVCHNGSPWLPDVLSSLRSSTVRPETVVAVDTGSKDSTPTLLAEATDEELVDSVLRVSADTGFAEAVALGLQHANSALEERPEWLWLLHDDCAPDPDCLSGLLSAADASPSSAVLGPIAVDWSDPRLIVEAGLSTDAAGRRRGDVGLDGMWEQSTEVLAVPSAGALIRRGLWDDIGGFDEEFGLLWEDIDFGWRVNVAGRTVLSVPRARLRHARAVTSGERVETALSGGAAAGTRAGGSPSAAVLSARRAYGLRTLLLNCSTPAFVLGLPRLVVLGLLRAAGLAIVRHPARARAELSAVAYLVRGHGQLREGRAERAEVARRVTGKRLRRARAVRGLFMGRWARSRRAVGNGIRYLVRRRMASEAALGRLTESTATQSAWVPAEELRAAAFGDDRPKNIVAVPMPDDADSDVEVVPVEPAAPRPRRPTPGVVAPRGLVFVEVDRKRILAATLFAPPVALLVGLTLLAVVVNWQRLGLDLAGGRLLPVADLGQVWSAYLAGWHPAGGGTSGQAPTALAVVGVLGALTWPLGGPAAAVAMLLLLDIPLSALSAYVAMRKLRVHRWVRALVAAGYALLPPATAAVAQGRIDTVAVHIVLPLVIAGVMSVLRPAGKGERWLPAAVLAAFGVAVIGAFSPLTHLMLVVGVLAAFVVVTSPVALARRIPGIGIVVLLPIALLLPWATVLFAHPELVLHGVGGRVPEVHVTAGELLSLHPGGPGAAPVGALLVVAAVIGVIVRPTLRAAGGIGIALLGLGAVAVLQLVPLEPAAGGPARQGWAGAPLLVVGIGLLVAILAVTQQRPGRQDSAPRGSVLPRLGAAAGGAVAIVFVISAAVAGADGPLRPVSSEQLTDALTTELATQGRSVLELRSDGDPPRLAGGGMPAFTDDDLPLPEGAPQRLAAWQDVFVAAEAGIAEPDEMHDVVARASAAGVLFVVLPNGVDGAGVLEAGGELVTTAARTADGRQVIRLRPVSGQVTLIAPELSRRALAGEAPIGDIEGEGLAVVDATLPDVRVRVSDGPGGRQLVLAATFEAGWRATVDGEPQDIVKSWGHQVGVAVPTRESEVVLENPQPVRGVLLLGQIGAVLFMLLTGIPARSRQITSGSWPR